MTDFQIVITSPEVEQSADNQTDGSNQFEVRQNSLGSDQVVAKIDELTEIWDVVVNKLSKIATKTKVATEKSPYELDTIEFNIGIEAGLSIGLVTKGDASVSVSFKKKVVE